MERTGAVDAWGAMHTCPGPREGSRGRRIGILTGLSYSKTEVWFDLVPSEEDGAESFKTTVPFVPVDRDGVMSIVVHIQPTEPGTGFASTRQACFPLAVPQWIPEPLPTG